MILEGRSSSSRSKKSRSMLVACREYRLKLAPPAYNVAPSGALEPRASARVAIEAPSRAADVSNVALRTRAVSAVMGNVSPQGTGQGSAFQIPAAYSAIVRSLENLPEPATFKIALRTQVSWSEYNCVSRESAAK